MKAVLAVVALALVALIIDEKAHEVAGEAQHAYGAAVQEARVAGKALSRNVEQRPFLSVLAATACGYVMAKLLPRG